jgi:hypothetical protein
MKPTADSAAEARRRGRTPANTPAPATAAAFSRRRRETLEVGIVLFPFSRAVRIARTSVDQQTPDQSAAGLAIAGRFAPKASGQEGLSPGPGPDPARLVRSSSAKNEWKDVENDNFVPIVL